MELHPTDILRAEMTARIVAGSIHRDQHGDTFPGLTAHEALGYADAILSQVQRHPAPVVTKASPYPWVEICPACDYRIKFDSPASKACPVCGRLIIPFPTDKPEPEMVPNPCAGLQFQATDFKAETNGLLERAVSMKMQELVAKNEAQIIQAIKDEGAEEERERLIPVILTKWNVSVDFLRKLIEKKP